MPLDVLIPHLLLPEGAPPELRGVRLPALERWLARADVTVDAAGGVNAWLATRFGLDSAPFAAIPFAAISLAGDDAAAAGTWLHADPVHFRVDRDAATLHHTAILDVRRDEADALVAGLQSHFAPDQLHFVAPGPERWYVRVPEIERPATAPLEDVLGHDVLKRLPRGNRRLKWPAMLTEAQMVLGAHEVNLRREERGAPAINGVWFWGEGAAPRTVVRAYARIHAADAFARGLAKLSAAALAPVPMRLADIDNTGGSTLVVLDDLARPWYRGDAPAWTSAAERLERDWFGALGEGLKRFHEMRLILPSSGGTRVASLTPSSRWRWFRRGAPLHA